MQQVFMAKGNHLKYIQDSINQFLKSNKKVKAIRVDLNYHENDNGVQTYVASLLYETNKEADLFKKDRYSHGNGNY